MENTFDFVKILRQLVKRIWLIILVTVIAGLISIVYTNGNASNIYSAQVSLYSVASGSYSASIQGFYVMKDYAEIARSKKVATRVANALPDYNLSTEMIQSMVITSYDENSAVFRISTHSNDPQLVTAVANAVAETFVQEVSNITGADNVKILDEASNAFVSYNGKAEQSKTRLVFAAGGFLLICVIIGLIEVFGTKVKEVNDCTLNGEIKLLGVIPKHNI